jgi:hypothetical protein
MLGQEIGFSSVSKGTVLPSGLGGTCDGNAPDVCDLLFLIVAHAPVRRIVEGEEVGGFYHCTTV